jgi:hypothetical protein
MRKHPISDQRRGRGGAGRLLRVIENMGKRTNVVRYVPVDASREQKNGERQRRRKR